MMRKRLRTMSFKKLATGSVFAILAATAAVRVQQAATPADGQQPADQTALTFRAGINFVTVDAYVSDSKGAPVTDLKQSDFDVLEDNKPQKIEAFRFIKVDGNPKP